IDYLLKPIKRSALTRSIDKYKSLEKKTVTIDYQQLARSIKLQEKQYKTRFLVKSGTSLQPIPIEQIAYFLADGNLVLLVTTNGKRYPVNYPLGELEGQLAPQTFFRINRQIIAHIQGITKVDTWFKGKLTVQLSPSLSEKTIISQQKAALFKNWLDGL
ncbi:MAG: LytTR family DNA-binding domain-containing protein, partial [Bacteroidota bacterium]